MENKIQSFKDLVVYQQGHKLVVIIYDVTKLFPKSEAYGLVSQMQRSAVSITSNIAEGFSRQSLKEKNQFFSTARGSLTELESQLLVAKDVGYLSEENFKPISNQIISVHKLLNAFISKTKTLAPYSKFHIPNSNKGFTLIELIVSIFILVTLSSFVMVNYRQGEKKRKVALAADGVINAVRLAQTYALAGKQIEATSCVNRSAKSYRINFDASATYIIYAEDNCSNPLFEIQRFNLPAQTQMKAGELKLDNGSINSLSVMFTPPFGKISASANGGAFGAFTTGTVGMEASDGQSSKSVTIDGVSGRIGE